jgi:hypothetical protein
MGAGLMKNKMKINGIPTFLVDFSVMKDMLEGKKGSSIKILDEVKKMKKAGMEFRLFTTSMNFHRALFIAKKIDVLRLRDILALIHIAPSATDNFMDEKATITDMVCLAEAMTLSKNILERVEKEMEGKKTFRGKI